MIDYKKMYVLLHVAASEALDALPDTKENAEGREILHRALFRAEEMYIFQMKDSKA